MGDIQTPNADDEGNRWVRIRCPLCGLTSPTCDQVTDVRRDLMGRWWQAHRETHMPAPWIEAAPPPVVSVSEQSGRSGGTP